jgi:SAM-dependent methyltransferase
LPLPTAQAWRGWWLGGLLTGLAGLAAAVEEVPFITTPDSVTLAMLQLASVGPRDHVIDLGSGDGRIVITAARRFGASGLGVEIDPGLVARSQANARQAGVAERAVFREQDLFATDLSAASVITMYLLPDVNLALRPRLLALAPGTRLVSHDWDMGDWPPDRSLTLEVPDKAIGREKRSRVHLWVVPAQAAGLWCAPGGRLLQLTQRFQQAEGRIGQSRDHQATTGVVAGHQLHLAQAGDRLQLAVGADRLQVEAASGPWATWRGQAFIRAEGTHCPD